MRYEDVWLYHKAVEGDPFEALFLIATTGGPGPAELLALRWEDWDEEASDVMIDEAVSALPGGEHEFNGPQDPDGQAQGAPGRPGERRSARAPPKVQVGSIG